MRVVDGPITTIDVIDADSSADVLRGGLRRIHRVNVFNEFRGTSLTVLILGLKN
jgi:hypothetical protein